MDPILLPGAARNTRQLAGFLPRRWLAPIRRT